MKIRIEKDWEYTAENSLIKQEFTAGVTYDVDTQTAIDAFVARATKDPVATALAKEAGKKAKSTSLSSLKKVDLIAQIKQLETGDIGKTEAALKSAQAELETAKATIAELEDGRDAAEISRQTYSDEVTQLQTDLQAAAKTLAERDEEIAKLQADLEAAKSATTGK